MMEKRLKKRIWTILAVIVGAVLCAFPIDQRINLGLDLKGGMDLILHVDTSDLDENAKQDAVPRAIEILRNRIDSIGVGETQIRRQGENKIHIQLPGVTDREKAKRMVGTVAKLDFHMVSDDQGKLTKALQGEVPAGYLLKYTKDDNQPLLLNERVALSGGTISDARVDIDSQNFGGNFIALSFKKEGTRKFGNLTRNNIGKRMAIVLDGEVLSAPTIQDAILTGNASITGQFNYDEASELALALRSGALPAPMTIEEERTVGPLLGKDSINSGISATLIGGGLVFLFMLFYYLKAGVVSTTALFLNLFLIVGIMGFLNITLPDSPMTLTLPGIAGIILTLGMAVDANVLINERIREEIENGRAIKSAINTGFDKAFKAILDSNLTTLIASAILFNFGSGPIKGFAVTLSIGLLASLFTALFVTRTIFQVLLHFNLLKNLKMMRLFSATKIDFVSKRYICLVISAFLIVASVIGLMQKKQSAYGIDFVGGQVQEYQFDQPVSVDKLRQALSRVGLEDAVIQQFKEQPENVSIRLAESGDVDDKIISVFNEEFQGNNFEVLRVDKVGPIVGKELRQRAVLAMLFALAAILIFVGFRFRHFDFAAAGVFALLHDVFISLGLLVLLGRQVDLLVVTALLTIAGYSINDTIIIYDRVRENSAKMKKASLAEIINLSVNQTLGRTILTTITTLLVVVTLFLKGGEVLNTFALCLMIGFIAGTYSTIFVASTIVLAWQKKDKKLR